MSDSNFYKRAGTSDSSFLFKMDRWVSSGSEHLYIMYDIDANTLQTVKVADLANPDLYEQVAAVSPETLAKVKDYLRRFQEPPYDTSLAGIPGLDGRTLNLMGIYRRYDGDKFVLIGYAKMVPPDSEIGTDPHSGYSGYVVLLDLQTGNMVLDSATSFQYGCRFENVPKYTYTYTTAKVEGDESEYAVKSWLDKLIGVTAATGTVDEDTQDNVQGSLVVDTNSQDTQTTVSGSNNVNHPSHYGGDTLYETIKVMEAWYGIEVVKNFCLGNVLKYISRVGKKAGADKLTDLQKAQWYLNKVIELVERQEAGNEEEKSSITSLQAN